MSQIVKTGRSQLQLSLAPVCLLPHPIEHIRSEVIEVLADLLLDAMGPETIEAEEVSNEHENHA